MTSSARIGSEVVAVDSSGFGSVSVSASVFVLICVFVCTSARSSPVCSGSGIFSGIGAGLAERGVTFPVSRSYPFTSTSPFSCFLSYTISNLGLSTDAPSASAMVSISFVSRSYTFTRHAVSSNACQIM